MKQLKIALSCAAAVAALSAQAETGFRFQPYAGLEYQHIFLDYDTIGDADLGDIYADGFNGGSIYLGARLHDNFGVELGYSRSAEEKKDLTMKNSSVKAFLGDDLYNTLNQAGVEDGNSALKLQSFTVDAVGYLPLDAEKKLELIGSIGLARTKVKGKLHANDKDGKLLAAGLSDDLSLPSETKTDLRLGFGAQYEVFDNFRVRGMLRWENTRFESTDKAYLMSLGFNYSF